MNKVCRLLFFALAGFLLFMGSMGLLSIKAEAKNGQDAANDIDGIYIHAGVEDRLAIEKDGVVLDGAVSPDGFTFAADGKTVVGKHTVSGGNVVVDFKFKSKALSHSVRTHNIRHFVADG